MAICSYVGCGSPAHRDNVACAYHATQFAAGELDWCPTCDRLKPTEAPFCDECSTWDHFTDDSLPPFELDDEWDGGRPFVRISRPRSSLRHGSESGGPQIQAARKNKKRNVRGT